MSTSYTCCCCLEDLTTNKMPDASLGCGCSIEVCCPCFLYDFMIRMKHYLVNEHGVSKWEDPEALLMFLQQKFGDSEEFTQANYDEKFTAYMTEHMYVGKPCAVCCTTVLWKLTELPGVNPTTSRLTFYAPNKRVQGIFPTEVWPDL